jgi:NADH-quinone oxidoreductase subunit M
VSLVAILVVLLAGGVLAWWAERVGRSAPRWAAAAALLAASALAAGVWLEDGAEGAWRSAFSIDWIPRFGIALGFAVDGLSLLMATLTLFLGLVGVACSWKEIRTRTGFFHFNLLWSLAGAFGVFFASDLFLFFLFWELMLIPMYLLIAIWGHANRRRAATKFFLFTQAGGLLMLVAIVALALLHERSSGTLTFDYFRLLGTPLAPTAATWLMLGFFLAFAVKLPIVPLHTWLPDAHTEAPTAGSVILAGVLLKTGAYGMLRFAIPLFPHASAQFAPVAMGLGALAILYGAVLAFAQSDLKRLVAYTSVSHLGFVLLGIYAWNAVALNGAIAQMVAHGLTTGALFVLVGALQERLHTRELTRMGGLWAVTPRLAAIGLFFAVASFGLPGLANFVGEFLVLLGAFRASPATTAVATLGLVVAAVYALAMVQRAFHGQNTHRWQFPDLARRETATLGVMIAIVVALGVFPRPVLHASGEAVAGLQTTIEHALWEKEMARTP